jgi:hypothetical protein
MYLKEMHEIFRLPIRKTIDVRACARVRACVRACSPTYVLPSTYKIYLVRIESTKYKSENNQC